MGESWKRVGEVIGGGKEREVIGGGEGGGERGERARHLVFHGCFPICCYHFFFSPFLARKREEEEDGMEVVCSSERHVMKKGGGVRGGGGGLDVVKIHQGSYVDSGLLSLFSFREGGGTPSQQAYPRSTPFSSTLLSLVLADLLFFLLLIRDGGGDGRGGCVVSLRCKGRKGTSSS